MRQALGIWNPIFECSAMSVRALTDRSKHKLGKLGAACSEKCSHHHSMGSNSRQMCSAGSQVNCSGKHPSQSLRNSTLEAFIVYGGRQCSETIFTTLQGCWEQEISWMAGLSLRSIDCQLPHRTVEPMLTKRILSTTEELLVLPGLVRKVRLESSMKLKDKSWVDTGKG